VTVTLSVYGYQQFFYQSQYSF